MSECNTCKYWNEDEGNCGAFERYGIDYPSLPCEEYYWDLLEEQHAHDVYVSGVTESEGEDESGNIQRASE